MSLGQTLFVLSLAVSESQGWMCSSWHCPAGDSGKCQSSAVTCPVSAVTAVNLPWRTPPGAGPGQPFSTAVFLSLLAFAEANEDLIPNQPAGEPFVPWACPSRHHTAWAVCWLLFGSWETSQHERKAGVSFLCMLLMVLSTTDHKSMEKGNSYASTDESSFLGTCRNSFL